MIEAFSHVQVVVSDVATSAPWYCTVLGLEEFTSGTIDSGPYAGLRHPTAKFVVGMQTATPEQAAHMGATSIDHLSFSVADRAALDQTCRELAAAGIDVSELVEEATSFNIRVTDPDGLRLEFTAPKSHS